MGCAAYRRAGTSTVGLAFIVYQASVDQIAWPVRLVGAVRR
jgi:hypothetical protein